MLYGSSILPSWISIGLKQVQLGEVVARSQKDSGLTVEQWNSLPDLKREVLLVATVYKMREEARRV